MITERRMGMIGSHKSSLCGRFGLLTAMTLLLPGLLSAQVLRYAAPVGAGSEDGSDWANAYSATNLQAAVDAAIAGGADSMVYLKEGEYALTNQLEIATAAGLTLSGGWAGSGGAPGDPGSERSVLTRDPGAGNMRIMAINAATNTLIGGVTITGGYRPDDNLGGGLYIHDSQGIILTNCVISGNTNLNTGGGLYLGASEVLLVDSELSNNYISGTSRATTYGGGAFLASQSELTVLRSIVRDNYTVGNQRTSHGAGIHVASGGTLTMRDAIVTGNEARHGYGQQGTSGGISSEGTLRLYNTLVTLNVGETGGIRSSGGSALLENCTVAYNTGNGLARAGGSMAVTNSILWGHTADADGGIGAVHSNVGNSGETGNGIVTNDPLFEFGFYLADGSPCRDAGTNATWLLDGAYTTWADGTPDSGTVDMGYHYRAAADTTYADIYVDGVAGNNGNSGLADDDAFETITYALTKAIDGSRIHVAPGIYTKDTESYPLTLNGFAQIDLLGTGEDATHVVLDATDSGNNRVMTFRQSGRVRLFRLTMTGGYTATGVYGGGLYFTSCPDVLLESCRVVDNRGSYYGGGLYLEGSVVTFADGELSDNLAPGGTRVAAHGGAAHVDAASQLRVLHSKVKRNEARGGLYRNGFGGAFRVDAGGYLAVMQSVVGDNETFHKSSDGGQGGAIYNEGTLHLRNTLIFSNRSDTAHSDGILLAGGSAELRNVTVADNNEIGIRYEGGTVSIENSIVWGHVEDLKDFPADGGNLPDVWYSCIGDGQNNGYQGCLDADPLFVGDGFYHLQSTVSNYNGGYFSGGTWETSAQHSPLIDRGDPVADLSHEPDPDSSAVNIGAYGNSAVASWSSDDPVVAPSVLNLGSLTWGHTTVRLRGEVTDTGGDAPQAEFLYWEIGGSVTSSVAVGIQNGAFDRQVTNLTRGLTYAFAVSAGNSGGSTVSDTETFTTHPASSVFYVSTNGNNTAGTNWATAFTDLQIVLDIVESGDTLRLAGDRFSEQHSLFGLDEVFLWQNVSNVVMIGGYEADPLAGAVPGDNDPAQWPTVLIRQTDTARIMRLDNVHESVIKNITITGGQLSGGIHGGGLYLSGCNGILLQGCMITNNFGSTAGGGLYLNGSEVTVEDTFIGDNRAHASGKTFGWGGGAYVDGSSDLTLTRVVLQANATRGGDGRTSYGAGLHVADGGSVTIDRTRLVENAARTSAGATGDSGAIRSEGGDVAIRNSLSTGNTGEWSIVQTAGSLELVNTTVADNSDGGLRRAGGVFSLTNSIVWGHDTDFEGIDPDHVWHSCSDSLTPGFQGNINSDPLFIDAAAGDYRLQPVISSAIDAGLNLGWMTGATDLAGSKRILFGRISATVDMGAYEAPPVPGSMFMFR